MTLTCSQIPEQILGTGAMPKKLLQHNHFITASAVFKYTATVFFPRRLATGVLGKCVLVNICCENGRAVDVPVSYQSRKRI